MVAKLIASTAALALMSGIALAQDATKPPADAMPADAANRAKTTVESGSDAVHPCEREIAHAGLEPTDGLCGGRRRATGGAWCAWMACRPPTLRKRS